MFQKWRQTKLHKRKKRKLKQVQKTERSVLKTQIIVGICISFALSLLGTGIWHGTRIESLQITNIEVMGGYTIPHAEIQQKVEERLLGNYIRLIPHSFGPLYPEQAIVDSIYTFARVKHVYIEVIDNQKLVVVFEEYRPSALWCEDYDTKECLFLDEFGFAFSQAPSLNGSAFIRYIDVLHTPEKKTQGFESIFIKETQAFADLLAKELDLYVTHVEKVESIDIEYTVSGGGILKVSQLMSAEKSFNNLKTILSSENFTHLQNGSFQYLDVRFGDKIFLNEEEEVHELISTSTASTTDS